MARNGFTVEDPNGQLVAVADDLQELIENLEEKEGLADAEDLIEGYGDL